MIFDVILTLVILVLLVKTNNLQSRINTLEMNVQRFMLRVIYGKDDEAHD